VKSVKTSHRRRAAAQLGIFVPLFAMLAVWAMDTPPGLAMLIAVGGGIGVISAGTVAARLRSRQNR
jgi:hypothetical protein